MNEQDKGASSDEDRAVVNGAASVSAVPASVPSADENWHTNGATGLEAAIIEFKTKLPGWWFNVCECQVSADASCAPTTESEHIKLAETDERFDGGFHADIPQPATLADALRDVMEQALSALRSVS